VGEAKIRHTEIKTGVAPSRTNRADFAQRDGHLQARTILSMLRAQKRSTGVMQSGFDNKRKGELTKKERSKAEANGAVVVVSTFRKNKNTHRWLLG